MCTRESNLALKPGPGQTSPEVQNRGISGPTNGMKLSDLDSLTFFIGWGILKLSDLDSLIIFIGGRYSEALRFGLPDIFYFGRGYSETLGLELSDNFQFGGGILKLSDLDSLTVFFGGGGGVF